MDKGEKAVKKRTIFKSILCIVLALSLTASNTGIAYANREEGNSTVSDQKTAAKHDTDRMSEKSKTWKLKKLSKQIKEGDLDTEEKPEISDENMIGNDCLEFMVNSAGLFTIGTVEGNPDYESDNGQILLYGHSVPDTSFSTIRIQSSQNEVKDFKFTADHTTYDKDRLTATSVMNVTGTFGNGENYNFAVTQFLEFVTGSRGLADTVKISYDIQNNGQAAQKAGVRILLDTMLAENDNAPFRVVGYDNITSPQ